MSERGGYGDYGMKDSWDTVTPMRAASPPRQMERENEMIVISHRLKFESRDEWLEIGDKTRRHQTSILRSSGIAHIYLRRLDPSTQFSCFR